MAPASDFNFDDSRFAADKKRVSKVILRSGRILDAMQFVYDGDKPSFHRGGDGGQENSLALAEGEYIVEISGSVGTDPVARKAQTVGKLEVKTNKGRSVSAGMGKIFFPQTPFSYTAPEGKQIFALKGVYYLNGMDFFISSIEPALMKDIADKTFDDSAFAR